MATHDYNLANQSGADFRADLNNALSAILSNNASATEPTTTTAYMLWVDTANNLLKMRNSADNAWITLPVSITTSNTVDIDGGTVNTITSLSFSSGSTVTTILDEDNLSSDSAFALATQQSIKAYVDSQVTAQDLDFQGDTGGALSIDLDSETFTISGGNGIDTSGALNTLTIAIDSSVVTLTDTQTLTNKTIDADSNTVSNLEVDNLKTGVLDTDLSSVSTLDDTLASAKAIKTYVDAQVTAQDLDLTDGTTSISIDLDSETLSVLGGTGITSTASGNGVTLAIGQDVGTTADVTFNTVAADLTGDVTGTVSSIANHSTTNLSEGTNLYYTTARFDSAFSGKSTSDLTEGTNLYYTDARARAAISVSGDLSYNSTTGVISFTERTDAEVRGLISGGTGVTYNNTTGVISIGQAVGTTDNVTFGNVVVSGDLTVSGTTTTINTETINLADNQIVLNSNYTGSTPTENGGIEIERGTLANKTLVWDETNDKWTVGSETFVAGTFEGALTGNVTGTVSDISNHDTGDLAEGTNLYYTTARFDSAFSGKSTSDLSEGTNLYHTTERVQDVTGGQLVTNGSHTGISFAYDDVGDGAIDATVSLSAFSTSDLSEGTNLYYTDTRFDTRLATKTTDNLTEGSTNLYYTDARVDSHLSGGTGVTYSSGAISIGQAVGTTDSVTFAGVTSDFTGDIEGAVKFTAKADVALTKGQVVYISGISGDVPTVNLADADNSSAMPAFGLVYANANANAEVEIITFGSLSGFDTSAFTVGKTVYVSTTAGALTTTAPTGESSLIQNIGMVQRSHATAGIIKVGGAGRTNATPNLNSGKIFYGNGSNQSTPTTLNTSIVPESGNLYYTDARARSAISVSGNALSYNSSTGVITSNYEESPTFTGTVTISTADINGGAIDNTVIGGTTPAAGTFTTLTANTSITGTLATAAQTNITSVGTLTGLTVTGDINFGDSDKAVFGAGSDLQIYHDGSNSYISEAGTGDLLIKGANIEITTGAGNKYFQGAANVARLYHTDNEKLATTGAGISVTGTVTADGAEIDVTRSDTAGSGFLTLDLIGTSGDFAHRVDTSNAYYLDYYTGSAWRPTVKIEGQTGDISFYEDTGTTAKLFWDASAESLGIGTSSPAKTLHISAGVNDTPTTFRIENTDTSIETAQEVNAIEFYSNDASASGTGVSAKIAQVAENPGNQYSLAFSTYNTSLAEAMRIDESGNLLINTTTHTLTDTELVVASEYSASATTDAGITLSSRQGGSWRNSGIFANGYALTFTTGDTGLNGALSTSEAMRIDLSGNLLVGKTSAGINGEGFEATPAGYIAAVRDGGIAGYFQRKTSNGDIIEFRKNGAPVGSIGVVNDDRMYFATADGLGLQFDKDNNRIVPCDADGASNSNVELGDAGLEFTNLWLSGGVYVGGTAAANKFDDYEEGTWTPTIGGTSQSGQTYSVQQGVYTKVGNLVTANFRLALTAVGTISGFLRINGLPFGGTASPGYIPAAFMSGNVTLDADQQLKAFQYSSNSFLYLYIQEPSQSLTQPTSSILNSNTELYGSVSYTV